MSPSSTNSNMSNASSHLFSYHSPQKTGAEDMTYRHCQLLFNCKHSKHKDFHVCEIIHLIILVDLKVFISVSFMICDYNRFVSSRHLLTRALLRDTCFLLELSWCFLTCSTHWLLVCNLNWQLNIWHCVDDNISSHMLRRLLLVDFVLQCVLGLLGENTTIGESFCKLVFSSGSSV